MTSEERIELIAALRKSIAMQDDIIAIIQSGEDAALLNLWKRFEQLVEDLRAKIQPEATP